MLTGMIETKVPESATHVSFVFVDFPSTVTLMSVEALFFLSLMEILTPLILSFNRLYASGTSVGLSFGGFFLLRCWRYCSLHPPMRGDQLVAHVAPALSGGEPV